MTTRQPITYTTAAELIAGRLAVHRRLRGSIPAPVVKAPAKPERAPLYASPIGPTLPLSQSGKGIRLDRIITVVCSVCRVTELDLKSPRRRQDIVNARQMVMWLARANTALSMPQIGKRLGNRNHTTILHGIRCVDTDRLRYEPQLTECIHQLAGGV